MALETSSDSEQESYYRPIKTEIGVWGLFVMPKNRRGASKHKSIFKTKKGIIQRIIPQLLT